MSAITVEGLKKNYAKGVRDFGAVELVDASLRNENLYGINLSRADLSGTNLSRSRLQTAHLIETILRRAILRDANLTDTNLKGAILTDTNLRGADLRGADLTDTNLRGADLRGAQMKNVCLEGTGLYGVDLGAALNICRIENCAQDGGSLIAVRWDSGIMFQRGCFWGAEDQMVEFLMEREAAWPRHVQLPFKATLKYWQAMMDACKLAMPAE